MLIADLFTGYGLKSNINSLSVLSSIVRLGALGAIMILMPPFPSFYRYPWFPLQLIILAIAAPIVFQLYHHSIYFSQLKDILKLISPYIMVAFFCKISTVKRIELLSFTFKIYSVVIFVSYVLNIGSSTYRSGQGWKSFFYAGNELAALLLITFPFFVLEQYYVFFPRVVVFTKTVNKVKNRAYMIGLKISNIIKLILATVGAMLPATKSIVLGFALMSGLIFKWFNRKINIFFVAFLVSALAAWPFYHFVFLRLMTSKLKTKTLFLAIYDKRFKYLSLYLDALFEEPLRIFYGMGKVKGLKTIGSSVELDFFDFAISYGVIAAIIFYLILLFFTFKYWSCSIRYSLVPQRQIIVLIFLLSMVVYIGHSLLVGHCIFSGMMALPFALVFSEIISVNKKLDINSYG